MSIRILSVVVALLVFVAGCAGEGAEPSSGQVSAAAVQTTVPATAKPVATAVATESPVEPDPTEAPTAEPTPDPTPEPTPAATTYAKLTARQWAKIVKSPDTYLFKGYRVWACITQFDAATGLDTFRADASYTQLEYWFEGDNAMFTGDEAQLADFLEDDLVFMNVTSLGSYSYDTQAGGNTTVPMFAVDAISRKGSC